MTHHDVERQGWRNSEKTALTLAGLIAAVVAHSSWGLQKVLALAQEWVVTLPIPDGDLLAAVAPSGAGMIFVGSDAAETHPYQVRSNCGVN
jgi:hypothetical protein